MDKETFAGAVKEASGAVKEAFGNAIGDAKMREAGKVEKVAGKAEKAAGVGEHEAHKLEHAADSAASEFKGASGNFSVSARLGWPLLLDDPTPLSSALNIPTLLGKPQ